MEYEQVRQHMRANGFLPPMVFENKDFIRFSKDGGNDKDSYLHIEEDWAIYGDWSTGEKYYCFRDHSFRTDSERSEMIRKAQEAWEAKRREDIRKATEEAKRDYDNAPTATNSQYARKKKVAITSDIKGSNGNLMIPLKDMDGNFRSVQTIFGNGEKRFAFFTSLKGAFYEFDGEYPPIICEGWATGSSIRQALPNRVLCAMSAGNIKHVFEALPSQTKRDALIFADWDDMPKGWSGDMERLYPRGTGEKGARESNCPAEHIFFPTQKGDFNDMACNGKDIAEWWHNRLALNEFQDINDLLSDDTPMEYLIEDWIPEQSIGIVYGKPGSYKTTLILDQALSIATGMDWKGKLVEQGQVLYCCGEGFNGLKKRMKAWLVKNDTTVSRNMVRTFKLDSNLIELRNHLEVLKEENFRPSLVVLDTFNLYVGGDENSTQDMTNFIRLASAFVRDFKCTLMLLHHTSKNKDNPEDLRGSSVIMGGIDFAIYCEKNKDNSQMRMKHAKMKDGEQMDFSAFSVVKVEIEDWRTDRFGKLQSACTIGEEVEWRDEMPKVETPNLDESVLKFKSLMEACEGALPSTLNDTIPYLNRIGMTTDEFLKTKLHLKGKGLLIANGNGKLIWR